jgi:hypothetical protein
MKRPHIARVKKKSAAANRPPDALCAAGARRMKRSRGSLRQRPINGRRPICGRFPPASDPLRHPRSSPAPRAAAPGPYRRLPLAAARHQRERQSTSRQREPGRTDASLTAHCTRYTVTVTVTVGVTPSRSRVTVPVHNAVALEVQRPGRRRAAESGPGRVSPTARDARAP